MKKIHVSVLSLVTLCLVGCGNHGNVSSSPATEGSENKVSDVSSVASENTVSSSKDDSSSKPSSEGKDSSVVSSDQGGNTNTSSSSASSASDVVSTPWPTSIQELMKQYLNGNVLPYVRLATKSSSLDYDGVGNNGIIIYGDEFQDSHVTEAVNAFSKAGWDTTGSTTSQMKATLASENLTAELFEDKDGFVALSATWEEPFDASLFTAWPQEIQDIFTNDMNGYALPLIYLGTVNPTTSGVYGDTFTITGGTWDDKILTNAKQVLGADGWTLTDGASYDDTKLTATKDMGDGWRFKLELIKGYYDDSVSLRVSWQTPFIVPSNAKNWSADTTAMMESHLDSHVIPYVYLATLNETAKWDAYNNKLRIEGDDGTWDDTILTNAFTTYTDAGWENINKTDVVLTADKTFEDGCKATIKLYGETDYYNYTDNLPVLEVSFIRSYKTPASSDNWSSETLDLINQNLAPHHLPYIGVGADTSTWNDSTKTLTITGDYFGLAMLNDAKAAFDADHDDGVEWTTNIDTSTSVFTASKKFGGEPTDEGYGDTMKVKVIQYGKGCTITVQLKTPYHCPDDVTDWSQEVKDAFFLNLNGHADIPFLYLNTTTVTTKTYSKELDLIGGLWDDGILDAAQTVFASWSNLKVEANTHSSQSAEMFKADKTFDNGDVVRLELYANYEGKIYIEFYITLGFNPTAGNWSTELETDMQNYCGHVLPYLYLGDTVTNASSSYNNYMTIEGGDWNDQIITLARNAFTEDDGWMAQSNPGKESIFFFKTFSDQSFVSVIVGKSLYNNAQLKIFTSASYTLPTMSGSENWDASTLDLMQTYLNGNVLPYFYVGNYSSMWSSYGGYLSVDGSSTYNDWHVQYVANAATVLAGDGYTISYESLSVNGAPNLTAYKETDGGNGMIKVSFYEYFYDSYYSSSNYARMEISYHETYRKPASGSWSSDTSTKIATVLGTNVIPYIYLGSSNPSCTAYTYSSYVQVVGGTWDEKVYQDMRDSLQADSRSWEVCMDYSGSSVYLVASAPADEDGHYITLKLTKDTNGRPTLYIYYK